MHATSMCNPSRETTNCIRHCQLAFEADAQQVKGVTTWIPSRQHMFGLLASIEDDAVRPPPSMELGLAFVDVVHYGVILDLRLILAKSVKVICEDNLTVAASPDRLSRIFIEYIPKQRTPHGPLEHHVFEVIPVGAHTADHDLRPSRSQPGCEHTEQFFRHLSPAALLAAGSCALCRRQQKHPTCIARSEPSPGSHQATRT